MRGGPAGKGVKEALGFSKISYSGGFSGSGSGYISNCITSSYGSRLTTVQA